VTAPPRGASYPAGNPPASVASGRWEGPPPFLVEAVVERALQEDLGPVGDVTSSALVPADLRARAVLVAKARGVVAGLEVARRTFRRLDPELSWDAQVADGDEVVAGTCLVRLAGKARALLAAERVALNFLQHLSGVATATREFVRGCAGTRARILDTRKTLPGMRALQRYAVRVGGGWNHRFGLFDGVLIKDNHVALTGGVGPAVRAARAAVGPMVKVAVEVRSLGELEEAIAAGADHLLLDNMTLEELRQAVRLCRGRIPLEASGGVTVDTVADVAATGVDYISVGAITHSAQALDISLEIEPGGRPNSAEEESGTASP